MSPDVAAMMRVNLTNRADQMDALATKAKSDDDAELFRRGAEKYRRLLKTLPERGHGQSVLTIDPPTTTERT